MHKKKYKTIKCTSDNGNNNKVQRKIDNVYGVMCMSPDGTLINTHRYHRYLCVCKI